MPALRGTLTTERVIAAALTPQDAWDEVWRRFKAGRLLTPHGAVITNNRQAWFVARSMRERAAKAERSRRARAAWRKRR